MTGACLIGAAALAFIAFLAGLGAGRIMAAKDGAHDQDAAADLHRFPPPPTTREDTTP